MFRMRKMLFSTVWCFVLILCSANPTCAQYDPNAFTSEQLEAAMRQSGVATETIYSVLTFDTGERKGVSLAILSLSRSGWHVTVLHRAPDGLKVEWRSDKLSDDFAVSSSDNLEIDSVDNERIVKFSGCARHECGGVDGVFGVLLYSSRAREAFFAHYSSDQRKPIGSFGSLEFSRNAGESGNERYKAALQKTMSAILHQ